MKYKKVKIAVFVLCVLISGICYTISRRSIPETEGMESLKEDILPEGEEEEWKETNTLPFYVHICGEVNSPGVYQLSEESRVFEAIEKAGGFTSNAAPETLNMAERIKDGMKIVVLSREEAATLEASLGNGIKGAKINLNSATKEELMTLRGVGEAKAEDIIKYRESHGGFHQIEDIMNISGIKDAAFQKIKDDITV